MKRRLFPVLIALSLLAVSTTAQQPSPFPTLEQYLGRKPGATFTAHEQVVRYLELAQQSSPLIKVERYGLTYEERPLVYTVITSPANHARLEEIRKNAEMMTRPDQVSRTRAAEIAETQPVIVWLAYGVHGNESSSTEAALMLVERLLGGGEEVRPLLEQCVIIVDPLQNPDGRERYIQWFRQAVGATADPNPDALQHYEPWPGGRYNHYMVDMNRDWAFASQRETKARVRAFQKWNPQVVVDLHEMSFQSNYFFPPTASPMNLNVGGDILKWFETFGRANAETFSERGWPFFVGERYDFFYPGYGDSWPALRGAVGMTYEMAGGGRAGTAVKREDGSVLTLADRAERHFATSLTTVRTAAASRRALILRTYDALNEKLQGARQVYLIRDDSPHFIPAVQVLMDQGIEVGRLSSPIRLKATSVDTGTSDTRDFPTGTAVVSTKQALGGLVQSLLERSPTLTSEFVEEQRKKIQADETDDFYDITAWSMPLSYALNAFTIGAEATLKVSPWSVPEIDAKVRTARFGYLIDGLDPRVYAAAARLISDSIRFGVSETGFTQEGTSFHRGTLVIQRNNNPEGLETRLAAIAVSSGARITSVDSGWPGSLALGSSRIRHVRDPKIALVGGDGTAPTSFGMLWFALDQETGIPHSVIPLSRLSSLDLSQYRVLIFPDGSGYDDHLSKDDGEKLKGWVRSGGTIVAVAGGSEFLRSKDIAISEVKKWPGPEKDAKEGDPPAKEERYNDFRIPGAAFRTEMNDRSYLTFGVPRSPSVLIEGTTTLLPLTHKVDNVITISRKDPLASGFAWPESIDRIKGAAYMTAEPLGGGTVITFADEPYYRLFWRGTLPLFLNAVLYSPSF